MLTGHSHRPRLAVRWRPRWQARTLETAVQEAGDAYSRGIDNLADGRFAEAIADFARAIELAPQPACGT